MNSTWLVLKQADEWFTKGLESSDIGAKWTLHAFFLSWLCKTVSLDPLQEKKNDIQKFGLCSDSNYINILTQN